MYIKHKYSIIIIVIFFTIYPMVHAQEMTFLDAYNRMYRDNSSLKAVNKQSETQHHISQSLKGLRYPSLNAYATGVVFDREIEISFNDARNTLAGYLNITDPSILGNWNVPVGKKEMAFAGFNAVMPIFTGGKINAAIKAGEIEKEISKKDIISTENRLITELVQRYYQVKLADEALTVHRQVLSGMERHKYNAQKLEENGIIAPTETIVAEVAVSEANREVLAAEKNAKLARTALANTLDANQISEQLISPFFTGAMLLDLEYYKESAINNFPELQKLVLQKDLAEQGIKAKKSMYYPEVAAFGQATLLHNDPIAFGILEHANQKPWVVGVGITYNLFDGLKNRNELKAAISTREALDFIEVKAQKDLTTLVESLYYEIQKSQEEIENLKTQEKLANELLRARQKAFSEGLATSTDVVDAENGLSVIKLMMLNAKYLYITSLAGLLEASGISHEFMNYVN